MYRSPPRPLPYDADPRYIRLQRDGLISRREKGSSHLHEESEPLRSEVDTDSDSLGSAGKWNGSACLEESKENLGKSSLKFPSTKSTSGLGYAYTSSEDEDVCPTCLEGWFIYFSFIFGSGLALDILVCWASGWPISHCSATFFDMPNFHFAHLMFFSLAEYTSENPKIVTKCSHHFHLGCIYEWMERSDNCPVCGKVWFLSSIVSCKLYSITISERPYTLCSSLTTHEEHL